MKPFFCCILFLLLSVCAWADAACLARSKDFFNAREFALAEETLQTCLRRDMYNSDMLISLAGVQVVLGKFAAAENNLKMAISRLGASSPYIAYVNSMLGDISMRKPNLRDAAFFYDAALRAEPANVNALVGRGIIEEKEGRTKEAANFFRRALAVDFTNIIARERLTLLEPDVLNYDEMLATLKERNIIDPDTRSFSMEDENMLRRLLRAERNKSIEYLSGKYGGRLPPGFIVERDPGKVYVRKMLTITGYANLMEHLSHDAKMFFISKNVSPTDLFKLRDFDGKDLFNQQGGLTDAGLTVYTKGLFGYKAYLEPGETLPADQREIDAMVSQLQRQGYSEITSLEFNHLLRHTRCSEHTLVKDVSVRVINLASNIKRVFVVSDPRRIDIPAILPWQYVLEFREERAILNSGNVPTYQDSFFGVGPGTVSKLCLQDGTLATGSLKELEREAQSRRAAGRR